MIQIDCKEMTLDDQLALASAVSDGVSGRALGLVKDASIVVDSISPVTVEEILAIVRSFVSKRKDARNYSVVAERDRIMVHTPDPLSRSRGRKDTGSMLPPNVLKCPFCGFVTPYEEAYNVHFRSHGAVAF